MNPGLCSTMTITFHVCNLFFQFLKPNVRFSSPVILISGASLQTKECISIFVHMSCVNVLDYSVCLDLV